MKKLTVTLALALALSAPPSARAYTFLDSVGSRWTLDWEGGDEIPWIMHQDGCPEMSPDRTAAILETSFQSWEDVDCATIGFDYQGSTEQETTGNDGVNLMVWRLAGWSYGVGALGVTGTWFGMGQISDADIEFNSVHYTWTETGTGGSIDLQSVATHEMGHFLGLGHSDQQVSVMFPTYSGGTSQRSLADDDIAGVCYLYPAAGGGCETVADCPPGYDCQVGDCVPVGDGGICSPCSDHEQCGIPGDLCVPYPDGSSRCGRNCSDDSDCEGAPGCESRLCVCRQVSGGDFMQCVASGLECSEGPECEEDDHCADDEECVDGECVERGCIVLGSACEDREECCSGMCLEGTCSQPCDWLEPRDSCPSGFYCMIQECGVGACIPGRLGSASRDTLCEAHQECSTGYCASTGGPTTCNIACDPSGINTCPDDEACYRIGGSSCGVCACQIGRLGDVCDGSSSCASGICATKSEESRCTRICASANPCPDGYDCLEAGRFSICWPSTGGLDAECEDDEDCTDGRCVAASCTRSCETDCDCAVGFACGEREGEFVCVQAAGGGGRGCDCAATGSGSAPRTLAGGLLFGLLTLLWIRRRR